MTAKEREDNLVEKKEDKRGCKVLQCCLNNGFLFLLLLSTVAGYGLGVLLKPLHVSSDTLYLIGFPGQLMLKAFLMIIVPLLFCSLVLGVSSLRKGGDSRMVVMTIVFFLILSTFTAIMGAVAGHIIHPGQKVTSPESSNEGHLTGRKGAMLDSLMDLIWNAIPSNIVEAAFVTEYTHVEVVNETSTGDDFNSSIVYKKTIKQTRGVNFMGILTFSIMFGCALAVLGDKGEQLHQVIEQLNSVIMSIMGYCVNLLPLGMFFWMLKEGIESGALGQILAPVVVYLASFIGYFAFHILILLPLLYLVLVRKNPVQYHRNLLPVILAAFGTSSSSATLPVTIRCVEESNRVNPCVTRFVLPLGMVVHMNGGAFQMVFTAIFLAQLEGIQPALPETVVMCLTAVLLSISAPAVASAGNPIYLLTILAAGGIDQPHYISIIMSMEWLLDRFVTTMNVLGDCYVAAFVESLCRNRLPSEEEPDSGNSYPSPVLDAYDRQMAQRLGDVIRISERSSE